jgi:hypothetical protein
LEFRFYHLFAYFSFCFLPGDIAVHQVNDLTLHVPSVPHGMVSFFSRSLAPCMDLFSGSALTHCTPGLFLRVKAVQ